MSKRSIALKALVVLLLVGMAVPIGTGQAIAQSSFAVATSSDDNSSTPDFEAIDEFVQDEIDDMQIPGAELAIVQGDKIVHTKGFGEATDQGRDVTASTPFKIGSLSKSFTALAVMQLVERGDIKLDEPVQTYLPWFEVADHAASPKITVRHLLNQTSGFSTAAGMAWMFRKDDSDDALENLVRETKDVTLSSDPGKTYHYSNLNYAIAGLIVQTVSGQPYEDYVTENIFEPLEMTHAHAYLPDAEADGLATGHQFWFGRPQTGGGLAENRATTPNGMLSASADDMAHYLIANLNGGRYKNSQVLSAAGISELHRGEAEMSDKASYGMGWIDGELRGIQVVAHNGDTGDFHATMMLAPDQKWGVVVLLNGSDDLNPAMDRVANGVLAKLLGVSPPKEPGLGANLPLLLMYALIVLIILQILGAVRSVFLMRRWARDEPVTHRWTNSPARLRKIRWIAVRVIVAAAVSLAWAGFILVVFPPNLGLPTHTLSHVDMGWPILVTGAIALVWGAIAKPLLALAVMWRTHARRKAPTHTATPVGAHGMPA